MYLDWGFASSTLPIAVAAAVAFGVAEALSGALARDGSIWYLLYPFGFVV